MAKRSKYDKYFSPGTHRSITAFSKHAAGGSKRRKSYTERRRNKIVGIVLACVLGAAVVFTAAFFVTDTLLGISDANIETTQKAEKDNKGKVSVDQQEKEMFKQLKGIGIDLEKNLVVQDMSSDLQTYFLRKNAILSTKAYQLKVNSAQQLGEAFQALQTAGISDVNIEKTDVSNIEELRQEVRTNAAKAARKNAEVLAAALGQQAKEAIFVQDYGY